MRETLGKKKIAKQKRKLGKMLIGNADSRIARKEPCFIRVDGVLHTLHPNGKLKTVRI